MFWNNKKTNNINIELGTEDRRRGIRIKPQEELFIKHSHYQSRLIDISAMGLSFHESEDTLYKPQDGVEVSIRLPDIITDAQHPANDENFLLICTVKMVYIAKNNYHCQIIQIDRENQNLLDDYILNEQKRQRQHQSR